MKNKLLTGQPLVYILYFGLITTLRFRFNLTALLFLLGGLFGMLFVFVDRFVHAYITRPEEHLSLQVKHLIAKKRFWDACKLLSSRGDEQRYLAIRSVFFMGAWIPAAFFVLTSTGSMFAIGLVMGIGLNLVRDGFLGLSNLDKLKWRLFWPIKRTFSDTEAKTVVIVFTVLFIILSLLLI
jgi:hypothetical protein